MRITPICSLVLAFASSAFAAPITFIHTGSGPGTIDGNAFSGASFTITSIGDTENISSFAGGFFIDHDLSNIAISGVGTYSITTGTRTFVNAPIVGYSRAGESGFDLFNGPSDIAFATWDMLSSIGPIAGTANILGWNSPLIETDGGTLSFLRASTDATFQAIIPEPASWTLLLGCLTPLFALRQRRP